MNNSVLLNGLVLTMEGDWKPEELDIIIENGTIIDVKKLTETELSYYKNLNYNLIDMTSKIIMPGFVNSHGHAAMSLLRSYGDDLPLKQWLEEKIWPFEDKLTADDIYWGTKLAIIEMLESGTTCFADMYFNMEHVAQAVEETGIRACLSRGMIGLNPNKDEALKESELFIKNWHNKAGGRITCTLGPHAPYTCPPEYLKEVIALAKSLNSPIQIHISETKNEVEECIKNYGCTQVELLENLGLFEIPTLAAHCVHINDNDINIFKKYNVKVSHNPSSNLKLASGIAPVPKFINNKLTVAIGTDGCASNNNLDMLEELKLTALLHKGYNLDPTIISAHKALEMATIEGAKALFIDDKIGSIAKNKQADIIAFDLNKTKFFPRNNVVSQIVYAANSNDISDVFVNGNHLIINNEIKIDKDKILHKAQKATNRILKELN